MSRLWQTHGHRKVGQYSALAESAILQIPKFQISGEVELKMAIWPNEQFWAFAPF